MLTQPDDDRLIVEDREAGRFLVNREAFVSEDIQAREQRAVFDRSWLYIGHSSEIPTPGRFVTRNVAGRPVIFTRDRAGEVRALLNTCRHRGSLVCRERQGTARNFYCMYHGWVYDLDGTLRALPGEDAYGPNFDRAGMSLVPVPRLDSYRDFWFVCFDPAAQSLHDYLAGAREYIDIILDQSPSGRMEIVSGSQQYDIRANWKLLVENSVDDYHLIATHASWMTYMRNSGVSTAAPKGSGLLLPTAGKGRDLGNGHLCIDNPNYRGRPVARWISIYGEDAREDIVGVQAELVERLGEARAARVGDTNRNLVIFPNLVINDGSSVTVRSFSPAGAGGMHVTSFCLGPVEETPAQRERRLSSFLTFYGPGGFATPDDLAALETAQLGYATWREVRWNDISRGMHKPEDAQLDTDEHHIRVFWRRWNALMEQGA